MLPSRFQVLSLFSHPAEGSLRLWRTSAVRSSRAVRATLPGQRGSALSASPVRSHWTDKYVTVPVCLTMKLSVFRCVCMDRDNYWDTWMEIVFKTKRIGSLKIESDAPALTGSGSSFYIEETKTRSLDCDGLSCEDARRHSFMEGSGSLLVVKITFLWVSNHPVDDSGLRCKMLPWRMGAQTWRSWRVNCHRDTNLS